MDPLITIASKIGGSTGFDVAYMDDTLLSKINATIRNSIGITEAEHAMERNNLPVRVGDQISKRNNNWKLVDLDNREYLDVEIIRNSNNRCSVQRFGMRRKDAPVTVREPEAKPKVVHDKPSQLKLF